MFPATAWDAVHAAGSRDPGALEWFAREYRAPAIATADARTCLTRALEIHGGLETARVRLARIPAEAGPDDGG